MTNECRSLFLPSSWPLYYAGPELEEGPLPALFYFSCSGKDSLSLPPFHGPVPFLKGKKCRVFSMDLPFHSSPPYEKTLQFWAEAIREGKDPISPFLEEVENALHFCLRQKIVDPKKLAVGGLSRGGWIALLLAGREALFSHLLAFAPLVDPLTLESFAGLQKNPILSRFDLSAQVPLLASHHIRFYIGNRDLRVNTKKVFSFLEALVASAVEQKISSPPIEMIMTPSIGFMGHGTAQESFQSGAQWLLKHFQPKNLP